MHSRAAGVAVVALLLSLPQAGWATQSDYCPWTCVRSLDDFSPSCSVQLLAADCTPFPGGDWPGTDPIRVGVTCTGVCCKAPPPFVCDGRCAPPIEGPLAEPHNFLVSRRVGDEYHEVGSGFSISEPSCAGYDVEVEHDGLLEPGIYYLGFPFDRGPEVQIAISGTPTSCAGDCDGDGTVTIDELMTGVAAALGDASAGHCTAMDCHNSTCQPGPREREFTPTIDCLVGAVGNALDGCSAGTCSTDAGCDDGNGCTADTCEPTGCTYDCLCR